MEDDQADTFGRRPSSRDASGGGAANRTDAIAQCEPATATVLILVHVIHGNNIELPQNCGAKLYIHIARLTSFTFSTAQCCYVFNQTRL